MGRLKKWFRYDDPGFFLNPLAQIFLIITLADGLAFTFLTGSAAVQSLGIAATPIFSLMWFGVILLLITAVNTLMLVTKNFKWGRTAAMLGFTAWFYVVVLYAITGQWLALIIHPLPQVAFWSWYYFAVKKYKNGG